MVSTFEGLHIYLLMKISAGRTEAFVVKCNDMTEWAAVFLVDIYSSESWKDWQETTNTFQLQLIEQTENNGLKVKFKGTEISFCLV